MVFGLDKVIELDDVGVVQFGQDFGLVINFSFASLFQSFDCDKLKFLFPSCLEYHRVFSLRLLLIYMIIVHHTIKCLNLNQCSRILLFYHFVISILYVIIIFNKYLAYFYRLLLRVLAFFLSLIIALI